MGDDEMIFWIVMCVVKEVLMTLRYSGLFCASLPAGYIGLTLNIVWKEPRDPNNANDVQAAERSMLFDLGWFANPVYGNGDYPEIMKQQVRYKSAQQGLAASRLPEFTEQEKQRIKGQAARVQ